MAKQKSNHTCCTPDTNRFWGVSWLRYETCWKKSLRSREQHVNSKPSDTEIARNSVKTRGHVDGLPGLGQPSVSREIAPSQIQRKRTEQTHINMLRNFRD